MEAIVRMVARAIIKDYGITKKNIDTVFEIGNVRADARRRLAEVHCGGNLWTYVDMVIADIKCIVENLRSEA